MSKKIIQKNLQKNFYVWMGWKIMNGEPTESSFTITTHPYVNVSIIIYQLTHFGSFFFTFSTLNPNNWILMTILFSSTLIISYKISTF